MSTSANSLDRNLRRRARAEAAAWIARLHGPARSIEMEAGFRAWLAADPENGRQFEHVTEVWDAGTAPISGIARMQHWSPQSVRSPWLLAAACVVVAIGAAVWGVNRFWLDPSYSTGIGEQRVLRLADGSRVTLNASTRVVVKYGDAERGIQIERGEALFEVADNPRQPFVVRAGLHRIKALGTAFVVRYDVDQTAVTLVEGKVAVSSQQPEQAQDHAAGSAVQAPGDSASWDLRHEIILTAGQRLTLGGQSLPKLDTPRLDIVTAWRRGEVMLDKTSLADVVTEMNRYDETTLVIDDPDIAALRISGIYQTGDNNGFAATIAKLYGLQVVREGHRIYLRESAHDADHRS